MADLNDPFVGNVGYAGDLMTMRGAIGNRQRKRLKPGMRLADGSRWTGNSQVEGWKKRAGQLQAEITQREEELEKVLQLIREVEPDVEAVETVFGKEKVEDETPQEETKPEIPQGNTEGTTTEEAKPKKKIKKGHEDVSTDSGQQLHDEPGRSGS